MESLAIENPINKNNQAANSPWQQSSKMDALYQLTKEPFWKKLESAFHNKKINEEQVIDTAVIFRFLIMQELLNITTKDIKKESKKVEKLSFAYNLEKMIPHQSEINHLRDILITRGFYTPLLDRCRTGLNNKKINYSPCPTEASNELNPLICPSCNSNYVFFRKRSILMKILSSKPLCGCNMCNATFSYAKAIKSQVK